MKSSDPQEEAFRNTTCRYQGHEWSTTASNYRLCQRDKCRAAERLQDGAWVSILPPTRTRQPHAMPQQSCLW
jgi:hypothetical protein